MSSPVVTADVREIVRVTIRELAEAGVFCERLAYSQGEAARLLGVTPRLIDQERRAGRLKAVKIGNRFVYSRADLSNYLNGQA